MECLHNYLILKTPQILKITMKLTLILLMLALHSVSSAQVLHGNNAAAGKYLNTGNATIYYEIYGKGKPVVLLHGGIFGYINEFSDLISKLQTEYMIIAIATRGHGRSEPGDQPFSYAL